MPYSEFHTRRSNCGDTDITLLDKDGTTLHETNYRGLLLQIIKLNDIATLNQYIAKHPQAALAPGEVEYYDPFWVAAAHGSTDVLHTLLEHNTADLARTEPLDKRGFLLLNVACRYAQLATARFLLDSKPPLGRVD